MFKNHVALQVAKNVRAFLNVEAGFSRGQAPEHKPASEKPEKKRPVASLAPQRGNEATNIAPENIVWIFGSGRSGSTWLSSMMGDMPKHALWGEPWVGALFGNYYYRTVDERKHATEQFIMGPHRETWLGSIRNFVLDSAGALFPDMTREEYLVIKEPNGSIGAPLLMEALPESRMIFLVRDPRDVVASSKDSKREGGFNYKNNQKLYLEGRKTTSDQDPDAFVRSRARRYLEGMGKAKEAYDAHEGRKALVKYEDLRADALEAMKRFYSELEIPVDHEALARVVEKHSWENIPEEQKGAGKFYRKATPGGWRDDLTPEQARTVEEVTAPLLEALYPEHAKR